MKCTLIKYRVAKKTERLVSHIFLRRHYPNQVQRVLSQHRLNVSAPLSGSLAQIYDLFSENRVEKLKKSC